MTTVGYGDIRPITFIETVFVIFFNLVSCGVFAYSINRIGKIMKILFGDSNNF